MSQRRKSLCVLSGVITSSQIFSSLGIQLVARWQFCSTTHVPSLIARVIMLAAIGPCTEGGEGGRKEEGGGRREEGGGSGSDGGYIEVVFFMQPWFPGHIREVV